jgi:hypothetical protein
MGRPQSSILKEVWECRQNCHTQSIASWSEMDPSTMLVTESDGAFEVDLKAPLNEDEIFDSYNSFFVSQGLPSLRRDSEDESSLDSSTCSKLQLENASSREAQQCRVSFSTVRVREHSLAIGDHPCCRDSLPLSLDWAHAEDRLYDVDIFEHVRNKSGRRGSRGGLPRLAFWSRRERLQTVAGLKDRDFMKEEVRRRKQEEEYTLKKLSRSRWGEDEEDKGSDKGLEFKRNNEPAALFHYQPLGDEERKAWCQQFGANPSFYDFATPPNFPASMMAVSILED